MSTQGRSKSSKYRGVSLNRWSGRWEAYIGIKGKKVHLGRYNTQKAAALAYNDASKKHFGKDGHVNKVR